MTTSGRHSAIADLSRGKSRMSAQMERTTPATPACSNRLGWVGGSSAYPVTSAPSASSHSESQLPLKPVWPVRNTRRPLQNERSGIDWLHRLRLRSSRHERPPCVLFAPESLDQRIPGGLLHVIERHHLVLWNISTYHAAFRE